MPDASTTADAPTTPTKDDDDNDSHTTLEGQPDQLDAPSPSITVPATSKRKYERRPRMIANPHSYYKEELYKKVAEGKVLPHGFDIEQDALDGTFAKRSIAKDRPRRNTTSSTSATTKSTSATRKKNSGSSKKAATNDVRRSRRISANKNHIIDSDNDEDDKDEDIEPTKRLKKNHAATAPPKDAKKPPAKRKKSSNAGSTRKKRNTGDRPAGERPKTVRQQMDNNVRDKVEIAMRAMATAQVMSTPLTRSDDYDSDADPEPARRLSEKGYPYVIHGTMAYFEQVPNQNGNSTDPIFLETPELHFWVGCEKNSNHLYKVIHKKKIKIVTHHNGYEYLQELADKKKK
jgi:hypothetical protein